MLHLFSQIAGFSRLAQGGAIGIIGGADGPTAVFVARGGDLPNALKLAGEGMGGIFLVMIVIALLVWGMSKFLAPRAGDGANQQESEDQK